MSEGKTQAQISDPIVQKEPGPAGTVSNQGSEVLVKSAHELPNPDLPGYVESVGQSDLSGAVEAGAVQHPTPISQIKGEVDYPVTAPRGVVDEATAQQLTDKPVNDSVRGSAIKFLREVARRAA